MKVNNGFAFEDCLDCRSCCCCCDCCGCDPNKGGVVQSQLVVRRPIPGHDDNREVVVALFWIVKASTTMPAVASPLAASRVYRLHKNWLTVIAVIVRHDNIDAVPTLLSVKWNNSWNDREVICNSKNVKTKDASTAFVRVGLALLRRFRILVVLVSTLVAAP